MAANPNAAAANAAAEAAGINMAAFDEYDDDYFRDLLTAIHDAVNAGEGTAAEKLTRRNRLVDLFDAYLEAPAQANGAPAANLGVQTGNISANYQDHQLAQVKEQLDKARLQGEEATASGTLRAMLTPEEVPQAGGRRRARKTHRRARKTHRRGRKARRHQSRRRL